MKLRKIWLLIFGVIALAINIIIIIESATGGDYSSRQSLSVTQFVTDAITFISPNAPIVQDQEKLHHLVRKLLGHFLLFGLSGIFNTLAFVFVNNAMRNRRLQVILLSVGVGLTMAFISEGIQLFIPGRAGLITDVFIDFSGYLLFTILIYLVFYLIYRPQIKRKENK